MSNEKMIQDIETNNKGVIETSNLTDSIKMFTKEVEMYPTLSKEETMMLWHKHNNGDKEARDFLISCHLRYAVIISKRKFRNPNHPHLTLGDLISAGCAGVVKAIDTFNPENEKGATIRTWVSYNIKKEIDTLLAIELGDAKINSFVKAFIDKNERDPQVDEIVEGMIAIYTEEYANGRIVNLEKVLQGIQNRVEKYVTKKMQHLSLDDKENDGDDMTSLEIRDETTNVEKEVENNLLIESIKVNLAEREKKILDIILSQDCISWLNKDAGNDKLMRFIYGQVRISSMTATEYKVAKKEIIAAKGNIISVARTVLEKQEKKVINITSQPYVILEILKRHIGQNNISKDEVTRSVKRFSDENNYKGKYIKGYLNGENWPLRREIILIALSNNMNSVQLNNLLRDFGCSSLYIRQPEDFALRYALNQEKALEVYYELCDVIETQTEIVTEEIEELSIITIKKILSGYEKKEMQEGEIHDGNDSTKTITNRLNNFMDVLIKKPYISADSFIKSLEKYRNDFVNIRQRTHRVLLSLLIEYIKDEAKDEAGVFEGEITKKNYLPIEERIINARGIARRITFSAGKDFRGEELQKNISNIMKLRKIDIDRDAFLSLATFFLQYKNMNEYTVLMNEALLQSGFKKLDPEINIRDKSILKVKESGKFKPLDENDLDNIYGIYWDGICSLRDSNTRTKYIFL